MLQCLQSASNISLPLPPFFFWLPLVALGLSLALFEMIFLCVWRRKPPCLPRIGQLLCPPGSFATGVCRNEQEQIRRRYIRDI